MLHCVNCCASTLGLHFGKVTSTLVCDECSDAPDDSSLGQLITRWRHDGCDDHIAVDLGYVGACHLCYEGSQKSSVQHAMPLVVLLCCVCMQHLQSCVRRYLI